MFGRLLFLLTVVPFLELYFLIQLSDSIGFGNTILIVLVTGVLGAWMLRLQGHSILLEMQKQGAQGQLPSEAIAKGFLTFIGGVLLLTPGILTDALGLSLIFPVTQLLWKKFFMGQWEKGVKSGNIHVFSNQGFQTPRPREDPFGRQQRNPFEDLQRPRQVDSDVIDVEVRSSKTVDKKEDN